MKLDILEKTALSYPRHVFPWHVHPDYHCISLVTAGQAILEIPNQQMVILPGDLLFVPAGLPHRTVVERSFSYKIIRFRREQGEGLLSFRRTADADVVNSFQSWFGQQHGIEQTNGVFLTEFLSSESPVNTLRKDDAIARCLEFMHHHFAEGLSLDDLSKVALRSSSHLLRTFRTQVGISPARYIMGLKIDNAKALIQTGHTLVDTALSTGFYDQSHFTRHFKKLAGLSPRAYQSLIR